MQHREQACERPVDIVRELVTGVQRMRELVEALGELEQPLGGFRWEDLLERFLDRIDPGNDVLEEFLEPRDQLDSTAQVLPALQKVVARLGVVVDEPVDVFDSAVKVFFDSPKLPNMVWKVWPNRSRSSPEPRQRPAEAS
jgi:hypothetical protein